MIGSETREEIAKAIYYAEIVADKDGTNVAVAIRNFGETLREIDPSKGELAQQFKIIAQKIERGEKVEKVYRDYLDPEMLHFMGEAQKNGLRKGEIIEQYLPIKEVASTTSTRIRTKLKIPLIITFLAIFMMNYISSDFVKIMEDGRIAGDFETAIFIGTYFLPITFAVFIAVAVPLLFFPHKVPKIKGLFHKINAMMAILFVSILNRIGHSPIHIIPFIKKTFHIKDFHSKDNTLKDLAKLLYHAKFINYFQASRITNVQSFKRDFPILLEDILNELKLEVELSSEIIEEAVGTLSTLLVMIPVAPALYVMGSVIVPLVKQAMNSI